MITRDIKRMKMTQKNTRSSEQLRWQQSDQTSELTRMILISVSTHKYRAIMSLKVNKVVKQLCSHKLNQMQNTYGVIKGTFQKILKSIRNFNIIWKIINNLTRRVMDNNQSCKKMDLWSVSFLLRMTLCRFFRYLYKTLSVIQLKRPMKKLVRDPCMIFQTSRCSMR